MQQKIFNQIQSLRAFSVLSVFLFHTNIPFFSNGYLGVDIFFVISGFVITGKIFEEYKATNKINFINFYKKRVKRIIPNLFFIVCVTYVFYLSFGPPDLSLFKETVFSLLGISNLYHLNYQKDYFNNIFDDPIGHTWSLGVEQQFYIIYPFILSTILFYKNKNYLIIFLFLISIISTSFFLINYKSNPILSFYFSPLRLWEFLIGAIFFLSQNNIKKSLVLSQLCFLLIVMLIFTQSFIINSYFKNILVVFFSGLLISSYKKNIFFENKFIIYFGNISYSFYLWHLPVLFFSDLYLNNFFQVNILFSFTLTLLLSSLSFVYIEKKFIYSDWKFLKSKFFLFVTILFFIFIIILLYSKYFNEGYRIKIRNIFYKFNYLENTFDWNNRVVFANNIKIDKNKVYNYCQEDSSNFTINNKLLLREECLRYQDSSKIFFSFGNSHTAQFLPLFNDLNEVKNIYYLHFINTTPPNELIDSIAKNFKDVYLVTNINDLAELERIREYFFQITNKKIKFILFNSTPNPAKKNDPIKCMVQRKDCFMDKNQDIQKRQLNELFLQIYKFEKNFKDRVFVFNSFQALCPSLNPLCPIYNKKNDLLIYRDDNHITYEGAKSIMYDFKKFLFEKKILN